MVERDLMNAGIPEYQIHVLSNSEQELEVKNLHPVADFMKTNVIYSGLLGLAVGVVAAMMVLMLANLFGWSNQVGWVPFIFLAIIAVGFCAWEGGFLGFQQLNRRFRRFQTDLSNDRHILFIDVKPDQEQTLDRVLNRCPEIIPAGVGNDAMPGWVVASQKHLKNFIHWAP